MFKQFASDALGLTNIGKIISPKDYDKIDSDDYIFCEDGEKIFYLIKSKLNEYCFTNLALIHIDGTTSSTPKKIIKRYEYFIAPLKNITIENTGSSDFNYELKFNIGDQPFSVAVDKNQIDELKSLYKALIKINHIISNNTLMASKALDSIYIASSVTSSLNLSDISLTDSFIDINEYCFKWFASINAAYTPKDFSDIFNKYINN